jgi:integrase
VVHASGGRRQGCDQIAGILHSALGERRLFRQRALVVPEPNPGNIRVSNEPGAAHLRHGAATLAHTAGADLKTVQDQLGHASIDITADLYTNVLPATQHRAAEATARLLRHAPDPRPRKKTGRKRHT